MKKSIKILILVVTLFPFIHMFVFLGAILKMIFSSPGAGFEMPDFPLLNILTYVWLVVMSVYYVAHVNRNHRLSKTTKIVLGIVLPLTNMYGMPLYWYLCIWRQHSAPST